jgi:hypothetical protein
MDFSWADIPRKLEVGDKIRLRAMPDDPNPLPSGIEGTVTKIHNTIGVIDVDWDGNYSLNLAFNRVPGDVDTFDILNEGSDAVDIKKSMPKLPKTKPPKEYKPQTNSSSLNKVAKSELKKGRVKDFGRQTWC